MPTAEQPAAAPAAPVTVPLSVDEYQRLRGLETKIAELQASAQAAMDAKEAEKLRALAEKGQVEEALKQQRESWERKHADAVAQYNKLEKQTFSERKNAVIASALSGRQFVGDTPEAQAETANLVRRLIQDDFEVQRDASGELVVRERQTGRPATDVLKEKLSSSTFSIFFAPSGKAGTGDGGSRPAPTPEVRLPGSPLTVNDIAADWAKRQNEYQSFGLRPIAR